MRAWVYPGLKADIRALRAKGHSISEISEKTGLYRSTVHRHCRDVKPAFGPRKSGPKRKIAFNVCKALHSQGLTYREIGKRLGCAHSAVYRTLKTGKAAA